MASRSSRGSAHRPRGAETLRSSNARLARLRSMDAPVGIRPRRGHYRGDAPQAAGAPGASLPAQSVQLRTGRAGAEPVPRRVSGQMPLRGSVSADGGMSAPLRIAIFVGSFPVFSKTFILRQITGLLDLGHEVNIFADVRAEGEGPVQPEVGQYRLLERTTFMDMPPETAPWEMPVCPLTGRTWPPGAAAPVHNARRVALAIGKFLRCLVTSPRLAFRVLDRREYGYQAASLSGLHRLAKLSGEQKRFDVLHAHFGPVGNSFRFAKELWRAPLVVSFHGYDFSTVPRKEGTGVYQRLFRTADIVTVNSEYTRGRVQQLGCLPAKLHKLPMGLNLDDFVFRERTWNAGEPIRILTVARLVEIKGHESAIRAVARSRERHAGVRYDIVGDGPLRKQLEQLVIELGLQDAITIHGAQDG